MLIPSLAAVALSLSPLADGHRTGAEDTPDARPAPSNALSPDTLAALHRFALTAPNVWRVDGPTDIQVERDDSVTPIRYRFDTRMLIDTKLPVAYPQPTPPDVLEIKAYPSVRRAEVSGTGNPDMGMNLAFWPLFQHIDRNDIAMTAPVEIDYRTTPLDNATRLDPAARPSTWTMSFLYEQEADGPTGEFGRIEVVDRHPTLVLAIGLRGQYRYSRTQAAMARLNDWLDANPTWQIAGDPRMLGYNGPDRRPADQWSELQVPIRLADTVTATPTDPVVGGPSFASKGLLSAPN